MFGMRNIIASKLLLKLLKQPKGTVNGKFNINMSFIRLISISAPLISQYTFGFKDAYIYYKNSSLYIVICTRPAASIQFTYIPSPQYTTAYKKIAFHPVASSYYN